MRHVGVALVLIVAALLRFKALSWGLRHPPHVDERPFVDYARTMLARHDLDHRFYEYPGLLFYLIAAVTAFVRSAADGAPYLAARALVASFSLASVVLAYRLGATLAPGAGLVAAALMAASPAEVRLCHMVRPDVVLETFVLAALIQLQRIGEKLGPDVGFGTAAGAATAVKFSGLLLLPAYLLQRALHPPARRALWGILIMAATFAVLSPYSVAHARAAWRGAWMQLTWHYQGPPEVRRYSAAASDYAQALLRAVGLPALVLAGIGLSAARRDFRRWAGVFAFPVLMVLVFSTADVRRNRFILSTTGVLAALAARGVSVLAARSLPLAAAAVTLAVGPPLIESARYVVGLSRPSSRDVAADWIAANAAPGSRVLVSWYANVGLDPRRFQVMRVDQLGQGSWRQALEADLVVAGIGDDRALLRQLTLVRRVTTPHPETPWNILLLTVPAELRPRYVPVRLSAAALDASENAQAVGALVDGDLASGWHTEAGQDRRPWVLARFDRAVPVGRIELALGAHPEWFGRHLQLWLLGEDARWRRVEAAEGWQPREGGSRSQVMLLDPVPARGVRIEQVSQVGAPWGAAELKLDALPAEGAPPRRE